MLGELYYKPWELWRMTFRDIILAIDGLRDRDLVNQHLLRRSTFIIASSNIGGKAVSSKMRQLWPINGDDAPDNISDAAYATLRKFKDMDMAEKAKKLTDARRT